MVNELFISLEFLQTPAGLIAATILTTNFIKWLLFRFDIDFDNSTIYRLITAVVSISLLFLFNTEFIVDKQNIILGVLNGFGIALASMGLYDFNEGLDL